MTNKKTFKIIIFLCSVFFSFPTFGREKLILYAKDIVNQPVEQRINYLFALEYTWQKEAANLIQIDSLNVLAKQLHDDKLLQYVKLIRFEYDIYLSKSPEEKDRLFKLAEQFANKSDIEELKATLYYSIGIYAFYLNDYTKGLPLVFEAKGMLEHLGYESFYHSSYYNKGFFDVYFLFEDYSSAIYYCQSALKADKDLLYYRADYYNNIGLCNVRLKKFDVALDAFQNGIKDAESRSDLNFKALIIGNIGNLFWYRGQFKEALPYLYQDAAANEKIIPENAVITRFFIAHSLLNLDSVNKAASFLTLPSFKMPIWTYPDYDLARFRTFALYNQKIGNYELASIYKDSVIALRDTIRRNYDLKKIKLFESRLQAEKYLSDKKEIEAKAQNAQLLRNLIIIALILLFGSIIYTFYNRRKQEKLLELEKQKQMDALHLLDIAKTRFFSNVSHELRTPLTLMLAPLSTMIKSGALDNRNFTLASLVRQNAQGLLKLVNEILDLSKLEANKLEVHEEKTVVYNLIRHVIANFESAAEAQKIYFSFEYSVDKYLQLMVDTDKLQKVLNNLLSNAFKFTQAGGSIKVTVTNRQNQIKIVVADTGRGIHPDDLPHIFNRFYQSSQADTLIEGGTGIGLSLSSELVKLMGGQLQVESTWGEGSAFSFEFSPKEILGTITTQEVEEMGQNAVYTEGVVLDNLIENTADKARPTILIVEDNASLRDYLTLILEPKYNILKAENGQVALDMLKAKTTLPSGSSCPDLILSDLMMPLVDGFQLLSTLKSSDTYCSIPFVMLTARAELQDKLKALRIGVDDYLVKPFEEDELFARIHNLLTNARLRQAFSEHPILENDDKNALVIARDEATEGGDIAVKTISATEMAWLAELETAVKRNLKDVNYSVERMASDMALSRTQLFRKLKHLTGLPPQQYLQEVRLQQALYLLETKQVTTVKNACYDVGLLQVKYFSQLFHERFGKLPSAYL